MNNAIDAKTNRIADPRAKTRDRMSDAREVGCDEAYGLQGAQQSHRTGKVGLRGVSGQRRTDHYCKCKSDRSMTDIQIFSNPQFGEIRTLADEANEPLFCASDVCKALGYTNPRKAVADHVDEGDVTKRDTPTTSGVQSMTFVNESGLYSLIFGSKLDSAKAFKKWVTSEVLPTIRKHGVYATPQTIDNLIADPDNAIKVFQTLKEERQLRQIAEAKIKEDAPLVGFANALLTAKTFCLIGELAKIISQNGYPIGQNRLFEWLRDNGYLGKHGERRNIPNQQYVEMGLFEIKKGVRSGNDGVLYETKTPKITVKGQSYFINKFLNR